MNLLSRIFGRDRQEATSSATTVDEVARREQLQRLESSLDALAQGMRAEERLMDNPGWRGRVAEYERAAATAAQLRRSPITRETLVDLGFEIRPLFSGEPPQGQEHLVPLQDAVIAAARELGEILPSERA